MMRRINLLELLEYTFFQNAVTAGIFASIIFGIVGTLIVVKRIVFIAGGISHASFGGIGMSLYLGIEPLIGATVFALGSALGIGIIGKDSVHREETTIGIIWAIGMAIGALFYHITPGYLPPAENFLFGNIMMIREIHLILLAILSVFTITTVSLLYKKLQAVSFDEEFSKTIGIKTKYIYIFLLILVSLSIVLLIRVVGIILLIAMLSIPPTMAGMFTYDMKKIMGISVTLSLFFTMIGFYLSHAWNTPAGPTIVTFAGITFLITFIQDKLTSKQ